MPVVPKARGQRSHLLLVLTDPAGDAGAAFDGWYLGRYRDEVLAHSAVLGGRLYAQHEIDVMAGRFPLLEFGYLGIWELGIDGAEEATDLITRIAELHRTSAVAGEPATWLYFPLGPEVGDLDAETPLLVIAFANPVPGSEDEFREWYTTRHVRHALHLPEVASGQCFEVTGFQQPGARPPGHRLIAVYRQTGTPQAFQASLSAIDPALLAFPSLDTIRFSEVAFRPLG